MADLFSLTCPPPCNPAGHRFADYHSENTYDIFAYWVDEFKSDPELSKSLHLFHEAAQNAAEVERAKHSLPSPWEEKFKKCKKRTRFDEDVIKNEGEWSPKKDTEDQEEEVEEREKGRGRGRSEDAIWDAEPGVIRNKLDGLPEREKEYKEHLHFGRLSSTLAQSEYSNGMASGLQNKDEDDGSESAKKKRKTHCISKKSKTPYKNKAVENKYTWADIIAQAIMSSPSKRLALSDIYKWISSRYSDLVSRSGWQNSVRHNLSVNPRFNCKPRAENEEKGSRGNLWQLNEDHRHLFVKGKWMDTMTVGRKSVEKANSKEKRKAHGCQLEQQQPSQSYLSDQRLFPFL